jgi:hypothetical protein
VLPRMDTSQWESGIPICSRILQGDDEGFCEGGFVANCRGYGGFVAHTKLAGRRCCHDISVAVLLCNVGAMVRVANVQPVSFWDLWCPYVVGVVAGRNG